MSEVDEAGNSPLPPPELPPLPAGEVVDVGGSEHGDRRAGELEHGTDNPEEQQDAPIQERGV